MPARDDISEIFDSSAWRPVEGFDLTDLTYHRAGDAGVVRIAFDRPEVRNAVRPQTVDELIAVLEHARLSTDVGCVLLTGNGPSPKDGGCFCEDPVGTVTDTVEDTVDNTRDTVDDVTGTVGGLSGTTEKVTEPVTGAAGGLGLG